MAYLDEDKPLYIFVLKTGSKNEDKKSIEDILQKKILKKYKTDDPASECDDVSTLALTGSSLPLGCWNSPKYATCISPGTYAFIKNNAIPHYSTYKWSDTPGSSLPDGAHDQHTNRYFEPNAFTDRCLDIREPEVGKEAAIIIDRWGDYNSEVSYKEIDFDAFNTTVRKRMKKDNRAKKSFSFHLPALPRIQKRENTAEEEMAEASPSTSRFGSLKHSVSAHLPWHKNKPQSMDDSCISDKPANTEEDRKKKTMSLPWRTKKPSATDPEVAEEPAKKSKRFKLPHFTPSKPKKIEEEEKPEEGFSKNPEGATADDAEKKPSEEAGESQNKDDEVPKEAESEKKQPKDKGVKKKSSFSLNFHMPHFGKHKYSPSKVKEEDERKEETKSEDKDKTEEKDISEETTTKAEVTIAAAEAVDVENAPGVSLEVESKEPEKVDEKIEEPVQKDENKEEATSKETADEKETKPESKTDDKREKSPSKGSPKKSHGLKIKKPSFNLPKPSMKFLRKKKDSTEEAPEADTQNDEKKETKPQETTETNEEKETEPKEETVADKPAEETAKTEENITTNEEPQTETENKTEELVETPKEEIETKDTPQENQQTEEAKPAKKGFGFKMPHVHMPKFNISSHKDKETSEPEKEEKEEQQTEEKDPGKEDVKAETTEENAAAEVDVVQSEDAEDKKETESELNESKESTTDEPPKEPEKTPEVETSKKESHRFKIKMPHFNMPHISIGKNKKSEPTPEEPKEAKEETTDEPKEKEEAKTDDKEGEDIKTEKEETAVIQAAESTPEDKGEDKPDAKVVETDLNETKDSVEAKDEANTSKKSTGFKIKMPHFSRPHISFGKMKKSDSKTEAIEPKEAEVTETKPVEKTETKETEVTEPKPDEETKKAESDEKPETEQTAEVTAEGTDQSKNESPEGDAKTELNETKDSDVANESHDEANTSKKSTGFKLRMPHISIPRPHVSFGKTKKSSSKPEKLKPEETAETEKKTEESTEKSSEETKENKPVSESNKEGADAEEETEAPKEGKADESEPTKTDEKKESDEVKDDEKKEESELKDVDSKDTKKSKFGLHMPKINWKRKSESFDKDQEGQSPQDEKKQEGQKSRFSFPWHHKKDKSPSKETAPEQVNAEQTEKNTDTKVETTKTTETTMVVTDDGTTVTTTTTKTLVEVKTGEVTLEDESNLEDFVKDTVETAFTEAFPEISLDEQQDSSSGSNNKDIVVVLNGDSSEDSKTPVIVNDVESMPVINGESETPVINVEVKAELTEDKQAILEEEKASKEGEEKASKEEQEKDEENEEDIPEPVNDEVNGVAEVSTSTPNAKSGGGKGWNKKKGNKKNKGGKSRNVPNK